MTHRIKQGIFFLCLLFIGCFASCTDYDFVETGRAQAYHDTSMLTYFKGDPYNYSYLVHLIERAGLNDVFEGKSEYGNQITFIAPTNHSIRRYLLKIHTPVVADGENDSTSTNNPVDSTDTGNGNDSTVTPTVPDTIATPGTPEGSDTLNNAATVTTRAAFDKNTATDSQIMQLIDEISVEECRRIVLSHVIPNENLLLENFVRGVKSTNGKAIGTGGKIYTMASGTKLWMYTFASTFGGVAGAGPLTLHVVSPTTQIERVIASHNIRTKTGTVHSLQYNFTLLEF